MITVAPICFRVLFYKVYSRIKGFLIKGNVLSLSPVINKVSQKNHGIILIFR